MLTLHLNGNANLKNSLQMLRLSTVFMEHRKYLLMQSNKSKTTIEYK